MIRSVAVLTEQEGHEITTMNFHTETIYDEEKNQEVPWKAFLITASATAGLIIYEEKNIGMLDINT